MRQSTQDGKMALRCGAFSNLPWSDPSLSRQIVFVGLLSSSITQTKLISYFSSFGRVVWLEVFPTPPGDDFSYAHLLFDSLEAVDRLFVKVSHRIGGESVRVRMWKTPKSGTHSEVLLNKRKVFVKNISPKTSEYTLRKYFTFFGAVAHIEKAPHFRVACSATAQLTFESPDSVDKCLSAVHKRIDGFKIKCKRFAPASADPSGTLQEMILPGDSDVSSLSAGEYSALIEMFQMSRLAALHRPSPTLLGSGQQDPPTRRAPHMLTQSSDSYRSRKDCLPEQAAGQKTFTFGQPSIGQQQSLRSSESSAGLNRAPLNSPCSVAVTAIDESLASSVHQPVVASSMRKPIFVNFFVVDGYI